MCDYNASCYDQKFSSLKRSRSPIQHRGLPVKVEEAAPPVQVLQRLGPLQLRVRPVGQLDQLLHGEVGGGGDGARQAVAHGQGVAAEKTERKNWK